MTVFLSINDIIIARKYVSLKDIHSLKSRQIYLAHIARELKYKNRKLIKPADHVTTFIHARSRMSSLFKSKLYSL
jgi:hypothetical protein